MAGAAAAGGAGRPPPSPRCRGCARPAPPTPSRPSARRGTPPWSSSAPGGCMFGSDWPVTVPGDRHGPQGYRPTYEVLATLIGELSADEQRSILGATATPGLRAALTGRARSGAGRHPRGRSSVSHACCSDHRAHRAGCRGGPGAAGAGAPVGPGAHRRRVRRCRLPGRAAEPGPVPAASRRAVHPWVGGVPGWCAADAGGFRAGDRVAAMPIIGGFAESVAVDARHGVPAARRRAVRQGCGAAAELPDGALRARPPRAAEEGRDRPGARRRRGPRHRRLPAGCGLRRPGDRGRVHAREGRGRQGRRSARHRAGRRLPRGGPPADRGPRGGRRRRPGRWRPVHRLPALAGPRGPAARPRLHRR